VGVLSPGEPAPMFEPRMRRALRSAGILTQPGDLVHRTAAQESAHIAAAEQFAASGYAVVCGLLPRAQLLELQSYCRRLIASGQVRLGDPQVFLRYAHHNEPVARMFLTALTGVVGAIVGVPVKPAYAYLASYLGGASLARHLDRAQCEYSISLLV